MTSRELGYKLAFLPHPALRHCCLQASSRHRPIARDRRGLLLGRSSVNNSGLRIIQSSPLQVKEFLQGGNIESFLVLVVGAEL